jgi:hypothetical protein
MYNLTQVMNEFHYASQKDIQQLRSCCCLVHLTTLSAAQTVLLFGSSIDTVSSSDRILVWFTLQHYQQLRLYCYYIVEP